MFSVEDELNVKRILKWIVNEFEGLTLNHIGYIVEWISQVRFPGLAISVTAFRWLNRSTLKTTVYRTFM